MASFRDSNGLAAAFACACEFRIIPGAVFHKFPGEHFVFTRRDAQHAEPTIAVAGSDAIEIEAAANRRNQDHRCIRSGLLPIAYETCKGSAVQRNDDFKL